MSSSPPVPYPLRMPDQLRARLKERAQQHDRSLHAEIIEILQEAIEEGPRAPGVDVDALAEALAPKLAARLREHD